MATIKLSGKASAREFMDGLGEIYKASGDSAPTKFRLVTEGAGMNRKTRLLLDDGREITGLVAFAAHGGGPGDAGFVTLTFAREQFTSEVVP